MPTKPNRRQPQPEKNETFQHPSQVWERNRPGRSGLDPMDTAREYGFMEGIFLRNLFTLRLRTRNVILLALMTIFGLGCLFPLVLIIGDSAYALRWPVGFCVMSCASIGGLFLLANVAASLVKHRRATDADD